MARFSTVFILLVLTGTAAAADKKSKEKKAARFPAADVEFFEKQVRPILVKRCYSCHSSKAKKLQGKLRLDSRAGVLKGGETGPAIKPGKPAKSLLVDAINYGDVYQMPPKSKLPAGEIAILTRWVKIGAPWSKETKALSALSKSFDLARRRATHWAWKRIANPPRPNVKLAEWPRDPLDHFILARLEASGLQPNAAATKQTWLRRVYFDLIGLPPAPDKIRAFLADNSPRAYQRVVDELLKSQHFGERWARHWMDLVRYAETFGHEFDYPIRHAHRYRDYLIRAFNADVPYDQFIIEHLAGDLLKRPRRHPTEKHNESILGTGFWMLGEMTHSPVDVRDDEARRIDNQLDVMGKAFLGLTIGCARCHDHKFDAISTRDYYALVGFMQSSHRSLAYLDPGQKIDRAISAIRQARRQADRAIQKLPGGTEGLAKFLLASRQVLLLDPAAGQRSAAAKIEGEHLKTLKQTSGKVMKQGGNLFSNNSQLWWIDAKIGGRLDLELNVPTNGRYTIGVQFIESYDYGIVQVSLDGKKMGKPIDLYHPRARRAKFRKLGEQQLTAGKHVLSLQIVGNNKRSKPRHMVGLDFVQLDSKSGAKGSGAIEKVARKLQVDPQALSLWVRAITDKSVSRPDHPLYLWSRLLRVKDKSVAAELNAQRTRVAAEQKENRQSKVFADFAEGGFKRWRQAGHAFRSGLTEFGQWDSSRRLLRLAQPGLAHSAGVSPKLQGVLRSPTFTLSHRFVDYHVAARGAQLRVIIDGYTMDTFNKLLFGGASVRADTGGKLAWVRQGGDIGRYLGHRAHIEIIDHGDGFIAVDQIRFTNGHRPKPSSVIVNRVLAKTSVATAAAVAQEYQRLFRNTGKQWITGRARAEATTLKNWMLQYGLVTSAPAANAVAAAKKTIEEVERSLPKPQRAIAISDGSPEDEFVFIRGNHKTPGPRVERRFLEALDGKRFKIRRSDGSGRLILARQIAAARNPLTSRVIVNRVWHHLTGRGIVASVDNFGVLGQRPTHPQLLDHLAYTFARDGWSLKRLMKRIVLSSTYRMSSRPTRKGTQVDPDNQLLHRMRIRRLQGEAIRDAILAVSGRLNRQLFGPSVPIHVTSHMTGRGRPRRNGPIDGNGRRSLYIEIRRNFLSPMMLAFDAPIPFNSMGRRNVSNVPAQALILMNDPLVASQAQRWGQKIAKSSESVVKRVERMYLKALGRRPTSDESEAAIQFIQQQTKERKLTTEEGHANAEIWSDLCHVMFNVKEFIFIR